MDDNLRTLVIDESIVFYYNDISVHPCPDPDVPPLSVVRAVAELNEMRNEVFS